MIYLYHEDKIVFINEETYIEREGECILIHTKKEPIRFTYDNIDLAIEAFNYILDMLENYSSVYGIII
ncbi:MAG: hypothetical protein ACOCQD_02130 [archaeon]